MATLKPLPAVLSVQIGISVALALGAYYILPARLSLACLAALLIGSIVTASWRSQHSGNFRFDEEIMITGSVCAAPDIRSNKILLTICPTLPESSAKILVHLPRYPEYRYGEEIEVKGTLEQPEPIEGFNYPLYLERQGIYGIIRRATVHKTSHTRGSPVIKILYRLRSSMERHVARWIPEPEASLLAGILLGSRQTIPEDLQAALRHTGTSHMVAISGANITILLGLLQALPFVRSRLAWTGGVGLFLVLLTGASASVMRGALVATLSAFLRSQGRRAWATPLLLCSASLLLLGNPLLLVADPGFQLSFAAFAGLAYFGQPIAAFIEHLPGIRILPTPMQSALGETLAASLGTLPISLRLFGQTSWLGLIVNPLILWLLPAITILGLTLITAGWLPFVAALLRFPLWLLLHAVTQTIQAFGTLPVGLVQIQIGWVTAGLMGIAMLGGVYRFKVTTRG